MSRLALVVLWLLLAGGLAAQSGFTAMEASIVQMQEALNRGEVTSVELVQQYLARIDAYDKQGPALNSITRINPQALAAAAALDRERARSGARGPLHGIPILVKDNYSTVDLATSGGSVALANFHPNRNATQIDKLLEAGVIILAKTNLHEYAYGITTVGSLFGQTLNPYDIRRVPGGSSGGTGAAVAANFGAIGLGSDTCGSIRIPASFNNLIGLRPSKGLSSIYGVMPLSHTQDVAGPLARSAEDLALVLDAVMGYDPRDAATELARDNPVPAFHAALGTANLSGLRLGKLEAFFENTAAAVSQRIDEALAWYEEQGAEIIEVSVPDLGEMLAASGLITQEFAVDLNAYLREFGSDEIVNLEAILQDDLHHQAVAGALQRSADVERDEQSYQDRVAARSTLRTAIVQLLDENQLAALVYPTISQLPVQVGDAQSGSRCSLSANSGLPALSMPVGFSQGGLPVGMELLGGVLADADLLAIAYAYEQANAPRTPPTVTPALLDGLPPQAQSRFVSVDEPGLQLEAVFEHVPVRNSLNYTIVVNPDSPAELFAATLIVAADGESSSPGTVFHNLLAPGQMRASGSYFMTPQFLNALEQGRVGLRLFAQGLPASGLVQMLDQP